jgi:aminoglycoside phosphotransferase (APT) family kinase protein
MPMAGGSTSTPGALIGQGRTAEIYAWGDDQVLKLYRAGWHASWAEREARLSQLVAATGLPVPGVEGVVEVDGRYGVLFERMVGPTLVQQFAAKPWTLTRAVRVFAELHVAMHARALPDLPSQRAQLAQMIRDASPVRDSVRAAALTRLDQLPDGDALCHGDYHPENVLMTRKGPVIIDWVSASSGHPLADVARTALLLQIGELPSSPVNRWLLESARAYVRRAYVRQYLHRRPARAKELAAWRLPIAVARLAEGIVEERGKLLRLIAAACP